MNQEKPKVYTAEFRESAVKLANDSDKPMAQTARDIGVHENTLHTWISNYSRPVENAKAVRTDDHLYAELKRLKKEGDQLAEERNLLKIGSSVLCQGTTVKYAWIRQQSDQFSTHSRCRFIPSGHKSAFLGAPTMVDSSVNRRLAIRSIAN